jgi:hypothetical protein
VITTTGIYLRKAVLAVIKASKFASNAEECIGIRPHAEFVRYLIVTNALIMVKIVYNAKPLTL